MDYSALEEAFIDISLEAGSLILDAFNAPEIKTVWKDDGSPVTVADMQADKIIRDRLARLAPDIPVVSEENSCSHASTGARRFILVDPLDGTSGFRRGSPEFTVNIALIEDGIPVMGVVHAPAKGRHFSADAQGMVTERSVDSETSSVAVKTTHVSSLMDRSAVRVIASRTLRNDGAAAEFTKKFEVEDVKVMSSSLKFCLVAAREADLYPRFGRTMEWDTAAGHAVLRAAGGGVVCASDGQTLGYGKPGFENPSFVAHAGGVNPLPGASCQS